MSTRVPLCLKPLEQKIWNSASVLIDSEKATPSIVGLTHRWRIPDSQSSAPPPQCFPNTRHCSQTLPTIFSINYSYLIWQQLNIITRVSSHVTQQQKYTTQCHHHFRTGIEINILFVFQGIFPWHAVCSLILIIFTRKRKSPGIIGQENKSFLSHLAQLKCLVYCKY